ncbi:MAG: thermonuclease family protein [Actinobacteria bacterium]|nr:thermonuclease family protein [Actinomycetota bacterium]
MLIALAVLVAVVAGRPLVQRARDRSAPLSGPGAGIVVRVVDGDTVDVRLARGQERVRLLGVDTPETVKPGTPVQCWGPEASRHTKALLPAGTRVRLVRDAEVRDRYGRLLAYVWRSRDDRFVNADLVAGGWARVLSIEPNTAYASAFAAAAAKARAEGRGLWGACPAVERAPPAGG